MRYFQAIFMSLLLGACASVDSIREIEPVFRAEAKQEMVAFRQCVFDAFSGHFTGTQKTQSGVAIGASKAELAVLVEQAEGYVTAYQVPYSLLRQTDLPALATEKCNDDPNVGLFDF